VVVHIVTGCVVGHPATVVGSHVVVQLVVAAGTVGQPPGHGVGHSAGAGQTAAVSTGGHAAVATGAQVVAAGVAHAVAGGQVVVTAGAEYDFTGGQVVVTEAGPTGAGQVTHVVGGQAATSVGGQAAAAVVGQVSAGAQVVTGGQTALGARYATPHNCSGNCTAGHW
jgi:hypothetical protein